MSNKGALVIKNAHREEDLICDREGIRYAVRVFPQFKTSYSLLITQNNGALRCC
jgi:hypothetical protein